MMNNYKYGGGIENAEMVMNNNNQIKHHTEELEKIVTPETEVPAWVVSKVGRSASDLSDATHYLDGVSKIKYADGGGVEYRSYVNNIYRNQSEQPARDGLMRFASEQGFEISDVENALQVYKYDTEENAWGENYYTKVAIERMVDMISGKKFADGGGVGSLTDNLKIVEIKSADENSIILNVILDGKVVEMEFEADELIEEAQEYDEDWLYLFVTTEKYNGKEYEITASFLGHPDYNLDFVDVEEGYVREHETYADGGGVGEFYVGQSIIMSDTFPYYNRMTKEMKRRVSPYYNKELVIEEIINNKPHNLAKAFVRSSGQKVPFEINLNKKYIQQYADGGGVGELKVGDKVELRMGGDSKRGVVISSPSNGKVFVEIEFTDVLSKRTTKMKMAFPVSSIHKLSTMAQGGGVDKYAKGSTVKGGDKGLTDDEVITMIENNLDETYEDEEDYFNRAYDLGLKYDKSKKLWFGKVKYAKGSTVKGGAISRYRLVPYKERVKGYIESVGEKQVVVESTYEGASQKAVELLYSERDFVTVDIVKLGKSVLSSKKIAKVNSQGIVKYADGGVILQVGDMVKIMPSYASHYTNQKAEIVKEMPDLKTYEVKIKHKNGNEFVKFDKSELVFMGNQNKYADGGSIPNNYEGKAVRHIWNSWSVSQRKHFLHDHNSSEVQDSYGEYRTEYLSEVEIENIAEVNYEDLPQDIKTKVFIHTDMGQYAEGGGVGIESQIEELEAQKVILNNKLMDISMGVIDRKEKPKVENQMQILSSKINELLKNKYGRKMTNGGGVGFRNTISRYNKMKELYQTNRESLEEINDYIDENYKGKKEEFIPLIYSVFPTTIKELGLTREDFVFWLNDPNYYQGYFSEDNIGEEDYANGGGVGKKLDWRLALGTHPKYYYGYNNGVIYATKEDNIELAEEWGGALYRRIKDIELVFPIKAKSFIDQESYMDFISLMLKTFPYREYSPTNGLTEVEIVEALNSDTMADGGVAYNPVWAEMEAYSPYSSRTEYENKKEYDDLAFASKSFSKSAEILVKENLMNGEICICKLRKILGHEPAYPVQYVGSIKLTKCFLKPFYKI